MLACVLSCFFTKAFTQVPSSSTTQPAGWTTCTVRPLVFGGDHIACLHRPHCDIPQVLHTADEGHGTVLPRGDELPTMCLHLGLDLAADVELVTVEGNALLGGQQVLLAGLIWPMVCSGMATIVPPENCLDNFLSSTAQPMYFLSVPDLGQSPSPPQPSRSSAWAAQLCCYH